MKSCHCNSPQRGLLFSVAPSTKVSLAVKQGSFGLDPLLSLSMSMGKDA